MIIRFLSKNNSKGFTVLELIIIIIIFIILIAVFYQDISNRFLENSALETKSKTEINETEGKEQPVDTGQNSPDNSIQKSPDG